ncbi:MAG: protease modulator HflC [Bradymonadaceae bacterium]
MSRTVQLTLLVVTAVGIALVAEATYVVDETEQVVVTQFGDPVGEPITEPGLKFKMPLIHEVHYFDQRYLPWNGAADELPTKGKRFVEVDMYARWRITDPLTFYKRLHNERGAQSRLDDIIDGATRDAVANHDLLEIVRATNREPAVDETLKKKDEEAELKQIETGRPDIMRSIEKSVASEVDELGLEVIDVRFKRLNYNDKVRKAVYDRMIAERQRIAELYQSEGRGRAADIRGKKEKKLDEIQSRAARKAEEIRGKADAKVTDIYAQAYQKDPQFYEFLRTLESYKDVLDEQSTLIMSTDSEYLKYLRDYPGSAGNQ